jgi:hypothetical protein
MNNEQELKEIKELKSQLQSSEINFRAEEGARRAAAKSEIRSWDQKPASVAVDTELQRRLLGDQFDTLKPSSNFKDAFRKEYGLGREHWAEARRRSRWDQGKSENAPRWTEMTESYPINIRLQQLRGKAPKALNETLDNLGMGLEEPGSGRRAGQLLGTLASDLTQDTTRGFYWLLNALQATGAVITESTMGKANEKLFELKDVTYTHPIDGTTRSLNIKHPEDKQLAVKLGFLDTHGNTRRGIRVKPDRNLKIKDLGKNANKFLARPRYNPGDLNSLLIPTGMAINSGLGLMSLTGGSQGYEAAVPDPDDKTKTSNIVGEVAAKYFLGRTGNLLPYEEFSKVRPDVSPAEYRAYKAFKYDKALDLNPLDGDFTLPTGVVKGTTEGLHGPEIQFLGRSLPFTTGIIPFMTALGGTRYGVKSSKPIRGGLIGGMSGLAAGQVIGNLIEGERRRRNKTENESYNEL